MRRCGLRLVQDKSIREATSLSTLPNNNTRRLRRADICTLYPAYWSSTPVLIAICIVPSSGATYPLQCTLATGKRNSNTYIENGVPCKITNLCRHGITEADVARLNLRQRALTICCRTSGLLCLASNVWSALAWRKISHDDLFDRRVLRRRSTDEIRFATL